MVYLFAKLFIVLPIMIFSEKSFKEASKISFKTIKGEGFQIAFLIIVGMLTWIMLTYLPFMVLKNVQFILLRVLRGVSNDIVNNGWHIYLKDICIYAILSKVS